VPVLQRVMPQESMELGVTWAEPERENRGDGV
jgi:hypothetical protein